MSSATPFFDELVELLPPLPDVNDISRVTGLAPQTIRNNRSAGKLPPAIKIGGRRVVWLRADVVKWILAGSELGSNPKTGNGGASAKVAGR